MMFTNYRQAKLLIITKLIIIFALCSCAGVSQKDNKSVSPDQKKNNLDTQSVQSDNLNKSIQINEADKKNIRDSDSPVAILGNSGGGAEGKPNAAELSREDASIDVLSSQTPEQNSDCEKYFKTKVKSKISFPPISGSLSVFVNIGLTTSRTIKSVIVQSNSGNNAFDDQVVRGIMKFEKFPEFCPENVSLIVRHNSINLDENNFISVEPKLYEQLNIQSSSNTSSSSNIPSSSNNQPGEKKLALANSTQDDAKEKNNLGKADQNIKRNAGGFDKADFNLTPVAQQSKGSIETIESSENYKKNKESEINALNGEWYSRQWKYGYTLKDGRGYATITNSPNFEVGQEIVRLTQKGVNVFSGDNVYKDGKFYKVKVTLQPDGKLFFEGERNVKWTMERISSKTLAELRDKIVDQEKSDSGQKSQNKSNSQTSAKYLSEKYGTAAMVICGSGADSYLRTVSKYSFKWDDMNWLEGKFDSYLTNVREPGVLTAATNKVSLQNGFGAYRRITLYCNYDVSKKKVLSYEIQEN